MEVFFHLVLIPYDRLLRIFWLPSYCLRIWFMKSWLCKFTSETSDVITCTHVTDETLSINHVLTFLLISFNTYKCLKFNVMYTFILFLIIFSLINCVNKFLFDELEKTLWVNLRNQFVSFQTWFWFHFDIKFEQK